MHNMIIRGLAVEITYVTDCSLGVRLYHDISAVIRDPTIMQQVSSFVNY